MAKMTDPLSHSQVLNAAKKNPLVRNRGQATLAHVLTLFNS